MSTDAHVPHVQAALNSGAARDFVAKPFDLDLLVEILTRAVSAPRAADEAAEDSAAVGAPMQRVA